MLAQVISLHSRPREACTVSSEFERLALAQVRFAFAWQREILRAWWGE